MGKEYWKAGNMLYPLPAAMVTVGDDKYTNIITVAWTGTICSDPAMVYISVRSNRYSYELLNKNKEFVINLTTEQLAKSTDYCGVRSGRRENKAEKCRLKLVKSNKVKPMQILESPVNIECKITKVIKLGSHDMFIAKVLGVNVDDKYIDKKGKFELEKSKPIVYSHGTYFSIGKKLGKFGYSVKKKKK